MQINRRLFTTLLGVLLLASPLSAQLQRMEQRQTSELHGVLTQATGNTTITWPIQSGVTSHAVTFKTSSGISAITVTFKGSTDGGATYGTTIGTSSSTGIATISGTGSYTNLSIQYSGVSGTGTIDADYYGNVSNSGSLGSSSGNPMYVNASPTPVSGPTTAANSDSVVLATDYQDPCSDGSLTKTNFNVRVASSSATSLISAQSSKTTYICWLKVETDGTGETISVVEAAHTSAACDGSQTALEGSTTASQGVALAANTGFVNGIGGFSVYKTSATAHEVCALNNSTNSTHFSGQWVAR